MKLIANDMIYIVVALIIYLYYALEITQEKKNFITVCLVFVHRNRGMSTLSIFCVRSMQTSAFISLFRYFWFFLLPLLL